MARALDKVQKKITKKRGKKPTALHENSRDAQRLRSAGMREDKLHRLMTAAQRQQQVYIDRITYFQTLAGADENDEQESVDETVFTDETLRDAVQEYIERRDGEIESLAAERRKGRPMARAETDLRMERDGEIQEFKSGFWAVDLRDAGGRDRLAGWKGSWGGLNVLKFVRVTREGKVTESSFPPKALS